MNDMRNTAAIVLSLSLTCLGSAEGSPAITGWALSNQVLQVAFTGGELLRAPTVSGPWTGTGNTSGLYSELVGSGATISFYRVSSEGAPAQASSPNPPNGATAVSLAGALSWVAGSGATSHDVYFGTSNPPLYKGNQTATTYNAGTLSVSTTYYWRVDEKNAVATRTGPVWSFTTGQGGTVVSIVNRKWYINGVPTHLGKSVEGLLMNVRMVNSIFEDNRNPSQWPAIMSGFNPDQNTTDFINKIPDYYALGIRAFGVNLQGGSPNYEGAWNSAYNADGTLRQEYMDRAKRVIDACNNQGMAVILGCFYQRQHDGSPTYLPYALSGQTAISNAVQNVANWIKTNDFKNVVLEIANEYTHSGFLSWNSGSWLVTASAQAQLMKAARGVHPGLLVSTSDQGSGYVHPTVATNADFILLHFNNISLTNLSSYVSSITTARSYQKPVLCNEDDKLGANGVTALQTCVDNGCGWGYMNKTVNQNAPFQFYGRADDTAVYDRFLLLTGGGSP